MDGRCLVFGLYDYVHTVMVYRTPLLVLAAHQRFVSHAAFRRFIDFSQVKKVLFGKIFIKNDSFQDLEILNAGQGLSRCNLFAQIGCPEAAQVAGRTGCPPI